MEIEQASRTNKSFGATINSSPTPSLQITMRRGSATVQLQQRSTFTETIDGQPLEVISTLDMGLGATTTTYRFGADGIEKHAPGASAAEKLPSIEGDWLTPAALERYVQDQIAQGRRAHRGENGRLHPLPNTLRHEDADRRAGTGGGLWKNRARDRLGSDPVADAGSGDQRVCRPAGPRCGKPP